MATESVRTPNRPAPRSWTIVHRKAAVVVAPITMDGALVLIRQERIAIQTAIWEVPAGQIDDAEACDAESIAAVARRELLEETGYTLGPAGTLSPFGHFFSSPGFTDEHSYFFVARGVVPAAGGHAHEESETILDCRPFPFAEVVRMIAQNEIRDANTLSICARLMAGGLLDF